MGVFTATTAWIAKRAAQTVAIQMLYDAVRDRKLYSKAKQKVTNLYLQRITKDKNLFWQYFHQIHGESKQHPFYDPDKWEYMQKYIAKIENSVVTKEDIKENDNAA